MTVDPAVLGALVAVCIAAFSGMGTLLLAVYRNTTSIKTVLHGENGDTGFIEDTKDSQHELCERQEEIMAQLQVQGRLQNEMVYSFSDMVEAIGEEFDEEVDTERMEDLQERANESRWSDDNRCGDD